VHRIGDAARTERPEVETRTPDELIVDADEARLTQALQNLIGNAIQHTPDGVPIYISVGPRADGERQWAQIEIHDEGPGIPPEVLPRLFGRHAAGGDSAGRGLGLYLARGIVDAHGGDLTVSSEPGEGTTFTLTLPLHADLDR
jgi:two-component system OmpR family sensor kinase